MAEVLRSDRGVDVALRGVVHLYPTSEGEVVALRGVDLDIVAGTSVALLGPSGAGKSTVLSLLAGTFAPSAGQVLLDGRDVARMSGRQLAELRADDVGLVVQGAERNLLPYATVRDNVWLAQQGAVGRGRRPDREPDELLDLFDLGRIAGRSVGDLAAGQRQQAALVAGVASGPRLLLLDEPTSRLSDDDTGSVVATIGSIAAGLGATVVMVTHDPAVAHALGRTVTIRNGRLAAEGRDGTDYGVVAADGSVQLPPSSLEALPPGSLVEVTERAGVVELRRATDR